MDVEAAAHGVRVDAELGGVRAHVVEGDLRRLLHHVAELAGERQPGLGLGGRRERRRLDEQHVAAVAGDGQAGGHAGQLGALGDVVDDLRAAEPVGQVLGGRATGSAWPEAILAAALRASRPSSRSSERTPASRV